MSFAHMNSNLELCGYSFRVHTDKTSEPRLGSLQYHSLALLLGTPHALVLSHLLMAPETNAKPLNRGTRFVDRKHPAARPAQNIRLSVLGLTDRQFITT